MWLQKPSGAQTQRADEKALSGPEPPTHIWAEEQTKAVAFPCKPEVLKNVSIQLGKEIKEKLGVGAGGHS